MTPFIYVLIFLATVVLVRPLVALLQAALAGQSAEATGFERLRPALRRIATATTWLQRPIWLRKVDALLASAGRPGDLTAREFIALKLLGGTVGLAMGLVMGGVWAITGLLVGFLGPDLRLRALAASRRKELLLALPGFIDMVALAVAAGVDFNQALTKVIERSRPSLLTFQFQQMFHEIALGATRRQALESLAERARLRELTVFTGALIQADRMGISLNDTLTVQAELIRSTRLRRAEKLGNEAPVKMLVPLVLFVLPATFIVLLGPVFLKMMEM